MWSSDLGASGCKLGETTKQDPSMLGRKSLLKLPRRSLGVGQREAKYWESFASYKGCVAAGDR